LKTFEKNGEIFFKGVGKYRDRRGVYNDGTKIEGESKKVESEKVRQK
jgi:hypothetical protein